MVLVTMKITLATSVKKPKKLTLVDSTSRGDLLHWWTSWILSGSLEGDVSQSRSTEHKAIPWQEISTFYQMKGFKLVLWNFTEASGEGLMGRELLTEYEVIWETMTIVWWPMSQKSQMMLLCWEICQRCQRIRLQNIGNWSLKSVADYESTWGEHPALTCTTKQNHTRISFWFCRFGTFRFSFL